jgi:hypothetical protein
MIKTFGEDDDSTRVRMPNGMPIEVPQLLSGPEQKYVGLWEPGIDHPTLPTPESGPYAGIIQYLPLPENQIER